MANRIDSIELTQANGTWISLINSASVPGNSTSTLGGQIRSQFNIAGAEAASALFEALYFKDAAGAITRRCRITVKGGTPPADADVVEIGQNGQIFCNGAVFKGQTGISPSLQLFGNTNAGVFVNSYPYNKAGEPYTRRIMRIGASSSASQDIASISVAGGYTCRAGTGGIDNHDNAFNFNWLNSTLIAYIDSSNVGTIQMQSTCDAELKKNKVYVTDKMAALTEVLQWKPATFKYKARGILPESETKLSFIANDLAETSPETVKGEGISPGEDIQDNAVFAKSYILDKDAMIAKLTLALQATNQKLDELQSEIQSLKA
ncbi:tail fiber domain-containing protein [Leclercia adecarboxylata]|uniref:Tail fiber domain-containing protein n=1 Tax=Leclercia adecarboxylata TaxID=83655 RepID=A0AAP9DE41_9ENTR|nr:tail fiber domain-containing protein [Leclercia adecarboxylata]QDK21153.1 tail fiber domain-containing protein [Leclercia adecarboxylata]